MNFLPVHLAIFPLCLRYISPDFAKFTPPNLYGKWIFMLIITKVNFGCQIIRKIVRWEIETLSSRFLADLSVLTTQRLLALDSKSEQGFFHSFFDHNVLYFRTVNFGMQFFVILHFWPFYFYFLFALPKSLFGPKRTQESEDANNPCCKKTTGFPFFITDFGLPGILKNVIL